MISPIFKKAAVAITAILSLSACAPDTSDAQKKQSNQKASDCLAQNNNPNSPNIKKTNGIYYIGDPSADTYIVYLHGRGSNGNNACKAFLDGIANQEILDGAFTIIPTGEVETGNEEKMAWYDIIYHKKIPRKIREHFTTENISWLNPHPRPAALLDDIMDSIPMGKNIVYLGYSEGGIAAGHYALENDRIDWVIAQNSVLAYMPPENDMRESTVKLTLINNKDDPTFREMGLTNATAPEIAEIEFIATTDEGHILSNSIKEHTQAKLLEAIRENSISASNKINPPESPFTMQR